jgi:arabinose-5-phosphate isomerase
MSFDASQFDPDKAQALARKTFEIEAAAVLGLAGRVGAEFAQAVQLMLACPGRVVVMGMGKSGHIGRKVAATLASTGTPALFVHPAEASHGDLGMITAQDVVLAISNSGEVNELTTLLPAIKRLAVTLIAITGDQHSSLARQADVVLTARCTRL